MPNKHGVFIQEEATAVTVPKVASASVQVVIGTAPVNMAPDPEAVVNTPILANSATEAMGALGYCDDFKNYTLCQTMYATSNLYQVSPVVYINVLDPKKHTKEFKQTIPIAKLSGTLNKIGVMKDSVKITRSSAGADEEPIKETTASVDTTERYGKKISELVCEGAKILPDGSVTGVFRHVKGYAGFSGVAEEQEGYYFPLLLGNDYSDKDIKVQRTSGEAGKEKTSKDKFWVLRLTDKADTVFTIKADEMPDLTLNFKNARFLEDDETEELNANEDYVIAFDTDGSLSVTMIDTGKGADEAFIQIAGEELDPSQIDKKDIIGAFDVETGKETGLEVIRQIHPKLGVVPGILLAPEYSQIPEVGIALSAKAVNINGVFKAVAYLDIPCGEDGAKKYTDVKTVKEESGFNSEYAYCLWPRVKVGDYTFAYSAVAAARTAFNDAERNDVPSASPSNKAMAITGTVLEDGTEVVLDQDQGTTVNDYGVATAININGYRMWGNYTAAYPASGDAKDIWLPVRRMFNWQGNTFILTYFDKVDDPMNRKLIENVIDSENIRCAAYVPDHWAGASIEYLAADNPITDILAGKMTFRQHIAPYTPAETITNILNYDIDTLQASLTAEE